MSPPLVSCIMPTRDRRHLAAQAIRYYLRQNYPRKELLILDDGTDTIDDLAVPEHSIFCTTLAQPMALGRKRNVLCGMARGKYICHWDDDDWQHPERLTRQVDLMEATKVDLSGLETEIYFDVNTREVRRYSLDGIARVQYALGNSMMYTREFWNRKKFPETGPSSEVAEDTHFVLSSPVPRIGHHTKLPLVVGIVHAGNTAPKVFANPVWKTDVTPGEVREILGSDYDFYRNLGEVTRAANRTDRVDGGRSPLDS